MGGEKSGRTQPEKLQPGSPPRGRGKASSGRTCAGAAGITPAWAGKRDGAAPTGSPPRDHPRVGGEKAQKGLQGQITLGSPPRGRGKGPFPFWFYYSAMDHPRVGGEKEARDYPKEQVWGSPPRGRGKASNGTVLFVFSRITPAWAGKSFFIILYPASIWDHPRVGGEKISSARAGSHNQGSPPRGRGKGRALRDLRPGKGITPAWAGKSSAKSSKLRVW